VNAVVIGGGADGLVAAHLLARAGRQVTLVNEHEGDTRGSGWVPPGVVRELELQLEIHAPDPWLTVALPDGGTLALYRNVARTVEALRRVSPQDAARWPDFCRRMARLAALFESLYGAASPTPTSLGLALKVRRLGREGMEDLMRVLPMSVAELLDDWFEGDALKGALGAMGIVHLQQGPRSAGTAFRLVHHHVGSAEGVFRPPRSNLAPVLRARAGVTVIAGQVRNIACDGGKVRAVTLADGRELAAALVVSGMDPRRTLLELADPLWLDPELARALAHVRRRGVVARLAFDRAPAGNFAVAPSLDYLERAYDESKYGRVSASPYLDTSFGDVLFQFAPYERADGPWDGTRRDELAAVARGLLPEAGAARVMAPTDLEAEEGWPQGQAYHAELALDQALWMRPLPELARYRTPIEGLWLCGPGTHPGGGIAGASAANCVREILGK
jgi:phytoene dehydrogenase-like protein